LTKTIKHTVIYLYTISMTVNALKATIILNTLLYWIYWMNLLSYSHLPT